MTKQEVIEHQDKVKGYCGCKECKVWTLVIFDLYMVGLKYQIPEKAQSRQATQGETQQ